MCSYYVPTDTVPGRDYNLVDSIENTGIGNWDCVINARTEEIETLNKHYQINRPRIFTSLNAFRSYFQCIKENNYFKKLIFRMHMEHSGQLTSTNWEAVLLLWRQVTRRNF